MGMPVDMSKYNAAEQQKIMAVVYGHNAVRESIKHNPDNTPIAYRPHWVKIREGHTCDVWDSYATGFLAGALISSGGRQSGEAAVGLAIVALALSSVASLFASIYQTVRGATLKEKASHGKTLRAGVERAVPELPAPTKDNIDAIYRKAIKVNSKIANKKFAYGASALVLGSGLAILTAVMVVFLRQHNFNWAILAPGIALTGLGALGVTAVWLSNRAWLPHDPNHALAKDVRDLIEKNQDLFSEQLLLDLEVLKFKPIVAWHVRTYSPYYGSTNVYGVGLAPMPNY